MISKKAIKTLKELCLQPGISGQELSCGITQYIFKIVKSINPQTVIDQYGNVVSTIGQGPYRVLLDAHLDEFGFLIKKDDKNIILKPQGGFDIKKIDGSLKIINKNISGKIKIGEDGQLFFLPKAKKDFLLIKNGDLAMFNKRFSFSKSGKIQATSLDNRIGCLALIELLKKLSQMDLNGLTLIFAFSAGEEIGKFYLAEVIKKEKIDLSIIVDAAYAQPIEFINPPQDLNIPTLRMGCALQTRGQKFVIENNLITKIEKIASDNKIATQRETPPKNAGRTNLSGLSNSKSKDCLVINIPVKNQHSQLSECHIDDFSAAVKLIEVVVKSISGKANLL